MAGYWSKEETFGRERLERLQLKKLKKQIKYLHSNSPFYRRKIKQAGIKPGDIKKLDDIRKLPFTTKDEIREAQTVNPPFGDILAVPMGECTRAFTSSGTTGKFVWHPFTEKDWSMWVNLAARQYYTIGVRKGDIFAHFFNFNYIKTGHVVSEGVSKIGALVVNAGTGGTLRHIETLQDLKITAMASTPTYALYMAQKAIERGFNPSEFPVEKGLFGGEPGTEIPEFRQKLEETWGMKAYDGWGITDIGIPIAVECEMQQGAHIFEDSVIVEVVDEEGNPVGDGEKGEIVYTDITNEAMPLIRFRSRDLGIFTTEKCECGRTFGRFLGGIIGRMDDMVKIRGVQVYPSQIIGIISKFNELTGDFRIVIERDVMDRLVIKAEIKKGFNPADIEEKLKEEIKNFVGVKSHIELLPEGSLKKYEWKTPLIEDRRRMIEF
jgi:phenylacetate-CoA ligase